MDKLKTKFIFSLIFYVLVLWVSYSLAQPCEEKLSNDFRYNYETKSIFGEKTDVPPKVIDYAYNKKYVIVKQKPISKCSYMYNYPEDFNDESYKNGLNEIYYWVISLSEKKVFGPMLLEDFNSMCKEKNIKLKFKK
jgi:hypothetical protein